MRINLLFLETGEKLIQHVENEYLKPCILRRMGRADHWSFQKSGSSKTP